jgi:hypothetical protein
MLTGEVIALEDLLKPVNLYIKDGILFTKNQGEENFITTYHLNNLEKIGDFLTFGNGPDEVIYLSSIQFVDSFVWIFDNGKKRLMKYGLSQFKTCRENFRPAEKISLDEMCAVAFVSDDQIITDCYSYPEARFTVFDMQGKFSGNTGSIPDEGTPKTDFETLESYFCNMELNPADNSIMVAYKNTDLIEIYNPDLSLRIRLQGPEQFFAVKKQASIANGAKRVGSVKGESRYGYFCPVALANEVWVVYDGKRFDPDAVNPFLNSRIIVFDWNGKPVRQYMTDIPFFSLAIDEPNKQFYGIAINPEFSIVRFNYGEDK